MIWKVSAVVLAVVLLALAGPAIRHLRETPPPPAPVLHAQLAVPTGVALGAGADALDAAIAPDGGRSVFVATRDGRTDLWLVTFADGTTRRLEGTTGAAFPAWKRDGSAIAFFAGNKLQTLTLSSGQIIDIADAAAPGGVTWLDSGGLVFVSEASSGLRKVDGGATSQLTMLAPGDTSHAFPFADAAGHVFYVAMRDDGRRVVRRLDSADTGAATREITDTSSHVEVHGDVLVHMRDNVLLAQRLDDAGTRPIGRSTALATDVGRSERGRGFFATSPRLALWAPTLPRATALAWFDAAGMRLATATEPGDYWQVRLSPDERNAAVTLLDPLLRTLDVHVVPLGAPGTARRISLAIGPDTDPVWSPDGRTLLYRSVQAGPGSLVTRPATPSASQEVAVLTRDADLTPSDWRGGLILFHATGAGGTRTVRVLDRTRDTEEAVTAPGFSSWNARWSANGRWVAYVSDEGGQADVYVQTWPGSDARVRVSFGGGQRPQWGDNGALYFLRADSVMTSIVTESAGLVASTPQPVVTAAGLRDFAFARSRNGFLVISATPTTRSPEGHLILDWLGLVPPPPAPPPRL